MSSRRRWQRAVRRHVEAFLCRHPRTYELLLTRRRAVPLEKIVFLNLVKRGDVVLDVGANRGYYTLLYSHLVGRSGEVHAFEPVPPTFEKLWQHVTSYERSGNVRLRPFGISSEVGIATIHLPAGDHGQASLRPHRAGSWRNANAIARYDCEFTTLDDYVREQALSRVDFLKMDIEGAELPALSQASRTLREFEPLIYLEVCADWTYDFGYSPSELVAHVQSMGYDRLYLLGEKLAPLHPRSVDRLNKVGAQSANVLFAISTQHGERIRRLVDNWTG